MKSTQLALLIAALLFFPSSLCKIIIWDLGGVLFKADHFSVARSVGLGRFISYALADWQNPKNIQPLLFDVLGTLGEQQGSVHQLVRDEKGQILPQIMCDWLTGRILPYDLIDRAHQRIDELDGQDYFVSNREKELLRETVSVIFDPEHFASNNNPIKAGIRLLKQCANHTDENGQTHTLIVLSNWDPHSFDLLVENHQEIFGLFDHVVISGDIGFAKPHHYCFNHLLKTYNLEPHDCYFIDDQLANVEAAEKCQMNGLLLKKGNYKDLKKRMQDHGLLA